MGSFVLPLPGMANYIAYGVDNSPFGGVITTGPVGTPLMTGLMEYHSMYQGAGRSESAIAVFGMGTDPGVLTVGPGEHDMEIDPATFYRSGNGLFEQ